MKNKRSLRKSKISFMILNDQWMATEGVGTWAGATTTTKVTTTATMEAISPKAVAVGEVATGNLQASTIGSQLGNTVVATKTCHRMTRGLSIIMIVIEMMTICHTVAADKVVVSVQEAVIIITTTLDLAQ